MQFDYTVIYVSDVEKTMTFYERAFRLPIRFLHESGEYGEMETGGHTLAFAAETLINTLLDGVERHSNRPEGPAGSFEISLKAQDVAEAYAHACAEGAVPLKPPELKPWGMIVAFVRDLNGVLVEICSERVTSS